MQLCKEQNLTHTVLQDGYSNAVLRAIARLPNQHSKALIGPWSHQWPDEALPGPQIGFLQDCRRFWDAHLRGGEPQATLGARVRLWARDGIRPASQVKTWPGRWIAAPSWPPRSAASAAEAGGAGFSCAAFQLHPTATCGLSRLASSGLDSAVWGVFGAEGDHVGMAVDGVPVAEEWVDRSVSTVDCEAGSRGGEWLSYGGPDLSTDQRVDDHWSLVWDSPPLDGDMTVPLVLGGAMSCGCHMSSRPVCADCRLSGASLRGEGFAACCTARSSVVPGIP